MATDNGSMTPLEQRGVEIEVASAFFSAIEERLGGVAASEVLQLVVDRLASSAAEAQRRHYPEPSLGDLWEIWQSLGGGGRLALQLDELTDRRLRFHVDSCAYADLYRERGLEQIGVAFSCRRDEPFAKALIPGVSFERSKTILEGSPCCQFTYTLEDR